ncbi:M1 family metallopeptidase [Nocardioides panacis]|uniref:M1 family metallopeptidase n=1 Tax=Nocardioides panacis TaxID=2849501 RepID=A0A975SXQ2_9ACTN|nr:M1 family metallopeptidase [Nocardioides panacis]QWZ07885.1 M1 family metallopeptidase [Nocardioides panacis]
MLRSLVAALTSALLAGAPMPAATVAAPSTPAPASTTDRHADSVYPSVGNPGVDVLDYGLHLRWQPRTRTLAGVARVRLVPARDGRFRLDLSGRLAVSRLAVTDRRTGRPVASTSRHAGRHLDVSAPGLVAGSTYDVVISYRGRPGPTPAPSSRGDMAGLGWQTTRDGQAWAMQEPYGAFTWYPVNDHPSDKATYRVALDVPRRWVGVSNGRLDSRRVRHGRTLTHFTNRDPMASYLMTVAIGPYVRATQTGPHGLPLSYWVPRAHPEYLVPLRATPAALRWLESRLGPYPFDRAGVVVTPSDSAMETQTLVTFGARNYRFGTRGVRQTVVHELAHAWYGDTVTPDDWSDLWMNEGMAMYVEALFSTSRGWQTWAYWDDQFTSTDGLWRRLYGPPGAYDPDQFAQINVYFCTARMLVRLRERFGAAVFDDLVRRWPQEHRNTVQDRTSYVAWLAASTGEDPVELRAFVDRWLLSRTPPA